MAGSFPSVVGDAAVEAGATDRCESRIDLERAPTGSEGHHVGDEHTVLRLSHLELHRVELDVGAAPDVGEVPGFDGDTEPLGQTRREWSWWRRRRR